MDIQVSGGKEQPWKISMILKLPRLTGRQSACLESLMVRFSLIISCLVKGYEIKDITYILEHIVKTLRRHHPTGYLEKSTDNNGLVFPLYWVSQPQY